MTELNTQEQTQAHNTQEHTTHSHGMHAAPSQTAGTQSVQERIDYLMSYTPTGLFMNGDYTDASDGGTFAVYNPSTGAELAQVASATAEDARRALDTAVDKQAEWAAMSTRERSEILYRTYELLLDVTSELSLLQSLELGRALPDCQAEVAYAAEFFRWFAEEAVRVRGDFRPSPTDNARFLVTQQPVGPVLAVTPWNFPLAMGARKLAPALAAGCTAIVKPASKTPLTMLYLAVVLRESGLPDGVLSVLPTANASVISDLLDDPRLRKLTFTGSTEVGQQLAAKAAQHTTRVSLELGGNAPYIVLDDAAVDLAAREVAVAKMRGAGQVCIAANRFLVHESLVDEFVPAVVEQMKSFTMGPGYEDGVTLGALSGPDQVDSVAELVDDAIVAGATLCLGGIREEGEGSFYPATVLTEVPAESRIAKEEIFGPVVAIQTFSTDAEAIRLANDTHFGLAAYVFSESLERALNVAESLEVGMVSINKGALSDPAAPFGGVKESGFGREGGFEGIREFLETKLISIPPR